jgi:ADP-dependent phosphofructokinase/glucokinase
MDIDIEIWNLVITFIIAPIIYSIRQNFVELKRVDVLLSKTREELAKNYTTKNELENTMNRLIHMLNKLEIKLDKLFEVKTN